MITLPVEFFQQEEETGCLAACSQMVLSYLGIKTTQAELNRRFEATPFGVPFSRLNRLEPLGVQVSIQSFGEEAALIEKLEQGLPSILFVRTSPLTYWNADTQHAFVLIGYQDDNFIVHDPFFTHGSRLIDRDEFLLAWDGMSYAYATIMASLGK